MHYCFGVLVACLVRVWAMPYTIIGTLIGLLLLGKPRIVQGVIEIHGQGIAWLLKRMPVSAAAMTLGHSVLARDRKQLDRTRRHERVHVRQFERWGFFMGPAYLGASIWMWWVGKDFYRDNPFEVEAFAVDQCDRKPTA